MKRALVTGASRGIGLEVARMLLADGWHVVGVSRSEPGIEHPEFTWWRWDVATPFRYGPLSGPYDALVHCAAIQGPVGPFIDSDEEAWTQTVATNLLGTVRFVRAALPRLLESDDARILLFSGGGAFNPRPEYTAYAASKAGVVSFMESLADELRHTTVSVNCVAPGYVPTSIHTGPVREDGGEAMRQAVACVRHLLSPAAYGLSGKTISAPHDDWRGVVGTAAVVRVNASVMGTRTRHPIAMVRRGRVAS